MPAWAERKKQDRPSGRRAAPTGASFLTIVAHSDDDLLFVNPDLQPAVSSGLPVRTVVLTADEYNGVQGSLTREQLAAQLREGTRRAYASLAGVTSNWRKETMSVADRVVELDTLVAAPQIQLIWLSLPDGGDDLHLDALLHLWEDPDYTTPTIVPTGGPVTQVQTYDGERLYLVLVALLEMYQPTVVRVQDPAPDSRYRPDHGDHVVATAFAQLAVRTYEGPGGGAGFALLTRYRCYNTTESAMNVPAALLTQKTAAYRQYNALDPLSGNGFDANLSRNHHRFPVSAPWVAVDGTGALHAVVVGADDVIHWRKPAAADAWEGPVSLRSGQFAPGVAMAVNADGRVQVAVLDLDLADVLTTAQTAPGGGFGSWANIGSPPGEPHLGVPALGRNSDGGLEMYMLDAAGGISNAFQGSPGGAFVGWFPVPANADVLGQPVTARTANGVLHVFADNNGGAVHWTQPPGGSTAPDFGFADIECSVTPSPVVDATGRARLLTREHLDGAVGTSAQVGTGWTSLTHLGGQGGVGPVAAVLSGGATAQTLVFARNDGYGVSVSRQGTNGVFGAWEDLGGYCEVGPAAVLDPDGHVRLLVVGADCRLHERRQTATGPTAPFTDWQVAGA